jgi:hypothetical protein
MGMDQGWFMLTMADSSPGCKFSPSFLWLMCGTAEAPIFYKID